MRRARSMRLQRADAVAITQQDGGDGLFGDEPGSDLQDAQILAIREHDALGVAAKLFQKLAGDGVGGG